MRADRHERFVRADAWLQRAYHDHFFLFNLVAFAAALALGLAVIFLADFLGPKPPL